MKSVACEQCKFHFRLLYLCQVVTIAGLAITFWQSYTASKIVADRNRSPKFEALFSPAGFGELTHHKRSWTAPKTRSARRIKQPEKFNRDVFERNMKELENFAIKKDFVQSPYILLPAYTQLSVKTLYSFCSMAVDYCKNPVSAKPKESRMAANIGMTTAPPTKSSVKNRSTPSERPSLTLHPGSAILKGHRRNRVGAWLSDANPDSPLQARKRWVVENRVGIGLLEFVDEMELIRNGNGRFIGIPDVFEGTNHIIYNNCFYYHKWRTNKIVRLDLRSRSMTEQIIPGLYQGKDDISHLKNSTYQQGGSYIDFSTDENGIWLIYRKKSIKYLSISSIDPVNLSLNATWKLAHKSTQKVVNTFVAHGILYIIEKQSHHVVTRWVFDIFRSAWNSVRMNWDKSLGLATMINYSPVNQTLFVYASGRLLNVPLAFSER